MKASFRPSRRPGLKKPLSAVTSGLCLANTFAHSWASAKVASFTQYTFTASEESKFMRCRKSRPTKTWRRTPPWRATPKA